MLREHFVEPLTRWSHERGALMREQAHGSPANLLDLYAAADIPETEIFGVLGSPDADPMINKFASSRDNFCKIRSASSKLVGTGNVAVSSWFMSAPWSRARNE